MATLAVLTLVFAPLGSDGVPRLACRFEEACIDGRRCFASSLSARITGIAGGGPDAVLEIEGERPVRAVVGRDGAWTSFRTWPDADQNDRTFVIDVAADGRAALVIASRGTAVATLSRTGRCTPVEEAPPP